jgi:hypothetical protein
MSDTRRFANAAATSGVAMFPHGSKTVSNVLCWKVDFVLRVITCRCHGNGVTNGVGNDRRIALSKTSRCRERRFASPCRGGELPWSPSPPYSLARWLSCWRDNSDPANVHIARTGLLECGNQVRQDAVHATSYPLRVLSHFLSG